MEQRSGPVSRTLRALWLTAFALLLPLPAQAFCRSTTCDARTSTCAVDENGCPREGAPLSWRALPLVYRFHAPGSAKLDGDLARGAVRRAFETWENITCGGGRRTSLRFEEGAEIPGTTPLGGNLPARTPFGIYFRDEVWPYDDGEESLALTNQTYGLVNGYIDYSDIEINTTTRDFALTDSAKGIDLQAVVTHEVGHYIGLAHSRVEDSIMVASYCQSSDRCGTSVDVARSLAADDISAVCAMYPPSGIAGVTYDDPASHGCAASPRDASRPGSWASMLGALVGLALVFCARRGDPMRGRPTCRWIRGRTGSM